jgi:uncharacterized coiled-coil DUF342 family protein
MSIETLEVERTAAVVADWKNAIDAIGNELNAANAALSKAKQESETIRAKASMGYAAAVVAFKHAQDAQREVESTIANLLREAMPNAMSQLAEAEREAGTQGERSRNRTLRR